METERQGERGRGRDGNSWSCGLDAGGETQAVRGRGGFSEGQGLQFNSEGPERGISLSQPLSGSLTLYKQFPNLKNAQHS